MALAATGARVLAVELDRALVPALEEVVSSLPGVRVEVGDALRLDWGGLLGDEDWAMVSNLPYNVAVPLVLDLLERVPAIRSYLVMVQREVGERLAAGPGEEAYGAVSVRVAYRADAELVRRVPAAVFWPRPKVESVLVRLTPRPAPVATPVGPLFSVIEAGFAERRKTMRSALRRLGLDTATATAVMKGCGLAPQARAETLSLADLASIADALVARGVLGEDGP